MKKIFPFLFLFILMPICRVGWAEMDTSKLVSKADKTEVAIGEPVRATYTGTMPKTQTIDWPRTIEGLKGMQVVSSGFKQGFPVFGHKSFKGWYILKGYEPGAFEVPAFSIRFLGKEGVERSLETQVLRVSVKSLVQGDVEKLDVKDLKGPYKPFRWKVLLGVFVPLLAWAAWFIFFKRAAKSDSVPGPPPVPPHILALEKIRALVNKDLISRGLVAEFYFELSMIVRQYLETRFSMRAPEMTTEEFLVSLKESQALSFNHKQLLKEFLSHCDMVKFAKYGPEADEIRASLDGAKKLIQETIPQ